MKGPIVAQKEVIIELGSLTQQLAATARYDQQKLTSKL